MNTATAMTHLTRSDLLASLKSDLDAARETLATLHGATADEREAAEHAVDVARWTLLDAANGKV